MSSSEIHRLLHEYGLVIVFAGVALQALGAPIPGTTILIAGAVYAAAAHGLPIAGVIAAGILGALAGTTGGFLLGRWGGEALLVRIGGWARQSPDRVARLRGEMARRGAGWLFIARFITGARNVAGLVAGASGMGLGRFVAVSAAAATVWATVNALEYYFFGAALAGASTWVQVGLIALGLAWLALSIRFLRRRAIAQLRRSEAGRSSGSGTSRGLAPSDSSQP